jgi:hypothetical protein
MSFNLIDDFFVTMVVWLFTLTDRELTEGFQLEDQFGNHNLFNFFI